MPLLFVDAGLTVDPASMFRVVEGRVLDAEGRPPGEGKVLFKPGDPRRSQESWVTSIDADGRFRIEIRDGLEEPGPLRYSVFSPGFRVQHGNLNAEAGPTTLNVRLTPGRWRETELIVHDHHEQPIANVDIDLGLAPSYVWKTIRSDAQGRCAIAVPPEAPFGVTTRRDGFSTTTFAFAGTTQVPPRMTIPIRPPIQGRVVDPEGRPVAGLKVGRFLTTDGFFNDFTGRLELPPQPGFRAEPAMTDAEGRFVIDAALAINAQTIDAVGMFEVESQPACFLDEATGQFAFAVFERKSPLATEEVVIRPLRRVRLPVNPELPVPTDGIEARWMLHVPDVSGHPQFIMRGILPAIPGAEGRSTAGTIEVGWPVGRYTLTVNCFDSRRERRVEDVTTTFEIPPGDDLVDLPPIRTKALEQLPPMGQPAPEIDARGLDTDEPVRLADYRGKVVVLDFWGYWCGPCVAAMPGLMDVHHHYEGRPVVILALHDQSVQSRRAYEEKIAHVKREVWGGKDLPFRVLLDRPASEFANEPIGHGLTCNRYRVRQFPTTLVIDQAGRVAGVVGAGPAQHTRLKEMIDGLLAKEPPR